MGLFSFVKNAGAKLFGKKKKVAPKKVEKKVEEKVDHQAADKAMETALEAVVKSLGLEVEGLNIRVDDDAVTISGIAASDEVREKVILAVGNVEGIASVDDQMETMPSEEGTPRGLDETTFYTVADGDTLWAISTKHYGDGAKYPVIFEANKPMLTDPDLIYTGQVLRIPPLTSDESLASRGVAEANTHTVVKGDTLWAIAEKHYGDGAKHTIIFEANKELLKGSKVIYSGQVLTIPPLA